MYKDSNIEEKSWEEFKNCGLLWFINTILHLFGWAIVFEYENKDVVRVFPARVKFRGFSEDINTEQYKKLTKYMYNNSKDLLLDFLDSDEEDLDEEDK